MVKADILFYNGKIYNTPFRRFFDGYFSIKGEKILHMGKGEVPRDIEAGRKVDLEGKWVIPGLIDSHMHVESSMVSPLSFAKVLSSYGVTTVVSEPHEIANVKGIEGVYRMIEAGKEIPIDIYYAIPSSVPSTSEEFETTGGVIDMPELIELARHPMVKCLGEVMNTNSVLNNPDSKENQFTSYLREHYPNMPLEGHVPRIIGTDLNEYVYTGIQSDHTEHDLAETIDRIYNGVLFQMQDKMVKPEIVKAIVENDLYNNLAIVTDDTPTSTLINKGHLNRVVMDVVEAGMDFEKAVFCRTKTPADRMRLYDRGQIMPGLLADFCILDTIDEISPVQTYKNGKKIYDKEIGLTFKTGERTFPDSFYETMKVKEIREEFFAVKAPIDNGTIKMKGLMVENGSTRTPGIEEEVEVRDGYVILPKGLNKLTVIERHAKNGNIFTCLAGGSLAIDGAVASSVAHDHHNLIVSGRVDSDMALAAQTVVDNCGGFAVVKDGKVLAQCALEICGLMSDRDPISVAKDLTEVEETMRELGYDHYDPIMSFATTCLPVSMFYKATDKGLVDVLHSEFVPLFGE